MRITEKALDIVASRINAALGTPEKPWIRGDGRMIAQIGNVHLYRCLGVWALHQMVNESGGIKVVVSGDTARSCYDQAHAYLRGLETGKEEKAA